MNDLNLISNNHKYLEIANWIKKSKDYLEDASALVDYGKRVGPISKIYYSNFYCAKALLLLYGKQHKKHSSVISEFGATIIKKERFPKKFGRFLNKMFNLRQKADYSNSYMGLSRKEFKKLLRVAESFINVTESFIIKKR